jgi:ElaA protein
MGLQDNAQTVSIGRVVIAMESRKIGIGTQLMRTALGYIEGIAPQATITLSAQHHLTDFYQALGFVVASEPYDEDGIPHVHMVKTPAF